MEAFGKPLPPKPRVESSDDEETKLAKEKAKKKTPYAVFDLPAFLTADLPSNEASMMAAE